MAERGNLFAGLPVRLAQEEFMTLLAAPGLRIERIVSRGQSSAADFWYDQPRPEWIVLLAGAATVTLEGDAAARLAPGDYLHIPAHRRHRVDWTDPAQATVWLAVHYG
ncbi:MAG TPA: cupin domain-containing protein [Xanthobacteraceae bacterium]|nr:cupin domain-containing protein [Xanthobacteraceae bacterium]